MDSITSSTLEQKQRIPLQYKEVQINFCKNPECENFGVSAMEVGNTKIPTNRDNYRVVASGKGLPMLHCKACGEHIPIKSNQGIVEELERMQEMMSVEDTTCPDNECSNHSIPITTPKAYQSFGKTKSGSNRYRCKACGKTFAVGKSTRYQKQPDKTEMVFKLLMNKSPLRRICEVAGIGTETLYHRIAFLEEQCKSFASHHESKLKDLEIKRLYLAVDRQDYSINWTERKDKRNTMFQGVATADNATRYVFAHHLNFDERLEQEAVELKAIMTKDYEKPYPFRNYARVWLKSDYETAMERSIKRGSDGTLAGEINKQYEEQSQRDDVEKPEQITKEMQLPKFGMQVHSEYTLYGHFFYLKNLLGNVGKFRFFLDQDSGMRAACLSAFKEHIKNRTCDAFYVSISKSLTVDEKRKCKKEAKKVFDEYKISHNGLTDDEVKLLMIKDEIKRMSEIGRWKDRWMKHPLPDMSEPEKMVCYLTDMKDYEEDHLAWLYNKASLHGVDNYFMLARRRVSMFERPIHSSANAGRVWNGYGAYNPNNVVKLLNIFRVFHNFMLVGSDGKTPAMRLGLVDKPVGYDEVIEFR